MARGRGVCKSTGNSVDCSSYHVLAVQSRFSSTTSNRILRAGLDLFPFKTVQEERKLQWRYKERNMPEKGLSVIADTAVIGHS